MRLPLPVVDSDATRLVYAATSRRAAGTVLGIDLSQTRCNWSCVYCDVEGLTRGEGPELSIDLLRAQLEAALDAPPEVDGAPADPRALAGVLFSGSGEPTASFQFPDAVEAVTDVLAARGLAGVVRPILLTNGAKLSDRRVRAGLERLSAFEGSAWVKLDSATRDGQRALNDSDQIGRLVRNSIKVAAEALPTWLQTCVFQRDGAPSLDAAERAAYVGFVRNLTTSRVPLAGIQLYSPNRPVAGPHAGAIAAPDAAWVEAFANELRSLLPVDVFV